MVGWSTVIPGMELVTGHRIGRTLSGYQNHRTVRFTAQVNSVNTNVSQARLRNVNVDIDNNIKWPSEWPRRPEWLHTVEYAGPY